MKLHRNDANGNDLGSREWIKENRRELSKRQGEREREKVRRQKLKLLSL